MRNALIALLAAPVALLAAGMWLLGTTSGTRAFLAAADAATGGAFHARGIDGRIAGPLYLARLQLKQDANLVELSDVRLEWHPLALLRGMLHIESLQARHMLVAGDGEKKHEPPKLPDRTLTASPCPLRCRWTSCALEAGKSAMGRIP
jgi:autotransporter translocation and assembly factor TamB